MDPVLVTVFSHIQTPRKSDKTNKIDMPPIYSPHNLNAELALYTFLHKILLKIDQFVRSQTFAAII